MPLHDEPAADGEPSAFAARDSTAEPASPAPSDVPPPERQSRRLWLYFTGIFLLGMCTGQPEGADTPEMLGELVGGGLGMLLISIVLVSVFLGWRRSTRPRIPGAAFILTLVMVPLMQAGDALETEEQFAALQRLVDSTSAPVDDSGPPPGNADARMLWATRKAMEDVLEHSRGLARAHGVDPDHPPEAWLSAAYIADARDYPEVHTYMTRYRSYLRHADTTVIATLSQRLQARLRQSGLSKSQAAEFMRGFEQGAQRGVARQKFATELELADRALKLHAYLVSIDARVGLDAAEETASFELEAERLQAADLIEHIERLEREGEAHDRDAQQSMRELGRQFGIPADTTRRKPAPPEPGTPSADVRKT